MSFMVMLTMSCQAECEGYPEVAGSFQTLLWEEAEHASKFAEFGRCLGYKN